MNPGYGEGPVLYALAPAYDRGLPTEAANEAVHPQRESQDNGRSGRRAGDDWNVLCAGSRVPADAIEAADRGRPFMEVSRLWSRAWLLGARPSGNQVACPRGQYAGDDERDDRD
jgi:hypothetical protein